MSRLRLVLLSALALGLMVVAVVFIFNCQPEFNRSAKRYAIDVAEGVRIWNPRAGVDAVRFASCRVEKLKWFSGLRAATSARGMLCLSGRSEQFRRQGGPDAQAVGKTELEVRRDGS